MTRTQQADTVIEPATWLGDVELPTQRGNQRPAQPMLQMLGRQVRRIRRDRLWSLRELDSRCGLAQSTLSRIEHGKSITLVVLWRLATGLGVHWADLLDDRTTEPLAPHTPASFEHQVSALAARVHGIRVLQHLTQPELAQRAGTCPDTIGVIERGKHNIKVDTLLRVAAGLGVHRADLLDDRRAVPPKPETLLREALERVNQLQAELDQTRAQLSLAQARVEVAHRVAHQAAVRCIDNVAQQARLIVDRYDRPHLAALRPAQLATHLTARRTLYDYLDRMWHEGKNHNLDVRPEWSSMVALRDLAQYLTETALDAHTHHKQLSLTRNPHMMDDDVDSRPITSDPAVHQRQWIANLDPDGDAGTIPFAEVPADTTRPATTADPR